MYYLTAYLFFLMLWDYNEFEGAFKQCIKYNGQKQIKNQDKMKVKYTNILSLPPSQILR